MCTAVTAGMRMPAQSANLCSTRNIEGSFAVPGHEETGARFWTPGMTGALGFGLRCDRLLRSAFDGDCRCRTIKEPEIMIRWLPGAETV